MKKINYLLSLLVVSVLLTSIGCDGGNEPSTPAADTVGALFAGTWNATSVTLGSEDRSGEYDDFTLTITFTAGENGGGMSISGGPVDFRPFATSDTWSFSGSIDDADADRFSIVRGSDDLRMSISNFSASSATMSFTMDESGSTSRTDAVLGNWTFELEK